MISQFAKSFPIFKSLKKHKIATACHQKIWIKNLDELVHKINKLKNDRIQNLDIVTDYDYTLTKHRYQGQSCHSLFGLWGHSDELPIEFKQNLINTYRRYGPYETDKSISFDKRVELLDQFYSIQKKLFSKYSFTKQTVENVTNESNIVFRYGAKYFFNKTSEMKLPVYIISGGISDILYNTIYSIVKDKSLENIYIFANKLSFKENYISDFHPFTIHSYNKHKVIPERIKTRKNCILMGDLVSDIYMTQKVNYQTQLSIFYSKQNEVQQRKSAQKKFDVIVQSDQSLRFVIFLINFIVKESVDEYYLKNCHQRLFCKLNQK